MFANISSLAAAIFLLGAINSQATPTPYPLSSGDYLENFSDISAWANDFASGIGANRWGSVAINATGAIPDGVKTTTSTATFSTGSSGGIQKGTLNLLFLTTGSTENTTAIAADLFLDFSGRNAGTLTFDWAEVNNSTGPRELSLKIYTSTDGTSFTELTAAFV